MSARPSRLRALGVAMLLALALLIATRQITPTGWYAEHAAYRAQVDAFLAGRLALSETPDALIHDLAWTQTGVQQVWGLGVPLWQTPFELVGRLVGLTPFPDRVPLLAWLVLVIYVALRAWGDGSRTIAIGSIVITIFLPGVVAMMRGRIEVYEEAALYAYGAAVMLLAGMICFARRPTLSRYWLLVLAAGLTGLIRPTVWFYGFATASIATGLWLRHAGRRAWLHVPIAAVLFVAGGAVLYATNAQRFGNGTEFGHRLNVHSLPGNIVATRFSYPFERVGLVEASEELIGSLFDRPELRSRRGFYQSDLHWGQSGVARWREYYFTTYSWSYVPVLLAGFGLGAVAWRRRATTAHLMWTWAVLGGAPLFAFYLRSPSVSSRYQLDLAPAFVALILIVWQAACARFHARLVLGVLGVAWLLTIATGKVFRPRPGSAAIDRARAAELTWNISRKLASRHDLPASYDLADPLLPIWTAVLPAFDRCRDETGTPISCASTPLAGDVRIHGVRDDQRWIVETDTMIDPEPTCAPEPQACVEVQTIANAPDVVRDDVFVSQDALYLNATGWDLVTGVVPPATYVYVQDAQDLVVDVDRTPELGDWSRAVRAAIGLHHLQLVAIGLTGHGARLYFEPKPGDRIEPGIQVAFLTFGDDRDLERTPSDYRLQRIAWTRP